MKKYFAPVLLFAVFEIVAVTLWLTKDNLFYLFNFSYIGTSIAFGLFLFIKKFKYACWTAMVLDFLPYKTPQKPKKKFGFIRYITFAASFIFVTALFLCKTGNMERIMFWSFLIGNILYYAVGIILAFAFKDNRAFCKYICPVTVFLKPMSYFSFLRIRCDKDKCISCGKCRKVCPMNVDMTDNSRKRLNGTECILCFECTKNCPESALK